MNQAIAEADDVLPWYSGMIIAKILGHSRRSFSHNFQQTNQRQVELPVDVQVAAASPACHFHHFNSMVKRILQSATVVMPGHTAPLPWP